MQRIFPALVAIFTLFFAAALPHDAEAKKKARAADPKNELVIKALGTLKWGDSKDQVIEKLKSEQMDAARADARLRQNRVLMQEAVEKIRNNSKKFAKTYTELKGKSNLEVSVIGDEFITDDGEAYLRTSDVRSNRYYFFYHRRLYKYVVAYNQSYLKNIDFTGFVQAIMAKYGRPTEAVYDDDKEDTFKYVTWHSAKAVLVVKNKQTFFGTYTMTFAEPRLYDTWLRLKERRDSQAEASSANVSAQVRSLMDSGATGSNDNALTSIVGKSNVNLASVIPRDKEAEEAEAKRKEEEAKKKAAEAKKAKKKKKKQRRKNKTDFDDIAPSSGGSGLIIY